MFANRLYYLLKPHLPWVVRRAARQFIAARKRAQAPNWPIDPTAGAPPAGWEGWHKGKRFAFVLTHDVEGERGFDRVRRLADIEQRLGFRSSFNFIPEGEYEVTADVRNDLTRRGFEIGVHDLRHDGKLFQSQTQFSQFARRINHYLREWDAVGFRSGFMLRNLEWMGQLDIRYDASTFDTDPFEPMPDGARTIFPFWVNTASGRRYLELPYSLPQDSTMFLILGEKTNDLWKKKLDWIAERGGMALLNVHPDYVALPGEVSSSVFPAELYEEFLRYVMQKYEGQYWNALPKEVASFVETKRLDERRSTTATASVSSSKPKIWIDMDNTPHVPFFEPIMDELKARGFSLVVTARDAFQVCDLADKKGVPYIKVGRHHGKNPLMKVGGLAFRAAQLAPVILKEKPILGVSHGSRSQLLLSNFLNKPTVLIEDYEHCQFPPMMRPTYIMAPEVIPDDCLPCKKENTRKYSGIKEDVYAWKLQPDPKFLSRLGIPDNALVITVRPPATEAHYHNPESEKLFERVMERATAHPEARIVLLPRNKKQGELARQSFPQWFKDNKTVIPSGALDGLNLIWFSDLVVSGGGTMNREAAALRVPVYSIFRGKSGAVDRQLSKEGRLVMLESVDDVDKKIKLERRTRHGVAEVTSRETLMQIVDHIEKVALSLHRA